MMKYFKGQILYSRNNPAETAEIMEYYPEIRRYLIKHSQDNKPKKRVSGGICYIHCEGIIINVSRLISLESEKEISKNWRVRENDLRILDKKFARIFSDGYNIAIKECIDVLEKFLLHGFKRNEIKDGEIKITLGAYDEIIKALEDKKISKIKLVRKNTGMS